MTATAPPTVGALFNFFFCENIMNGCDSCIAAINGLARLKCATCLSLPTVKVAIPDVDALETNDLGDEDVEAIPDDLLSITSNSGQSLLSLDESEEEGEGEDVDQLAAISTSKLSRHGVKDDAVSVQKNKKQRVNERRPMNSAELAARVKYLNEIRKLNRTADPLIVPLSVHAWLNGQIIVPVTKKIPLTADQYPARSAYLFKVREENKKHGTEFVPLSLQDWREKWDLDNGIIHSQRDSAIALNSTISVATQEKQPKKTAKRNLPLSAIPVQSFVDDTFSTTATHSPTIFFTSGPNTPHPMHLTDFSKKQAMTPEELRCRVNYLNKIRDANRRDHTAVIPLSVADWKMRRAISDEEAMGMDGAEFERWREYVSVAGSDFLSVKEWRRGSKVSPASAVALPAGLADKPIS